MKKEGSMLIEVMVSIAILTLTTIFIISANIENSNIIKKRILAEEVNRGVYNLMNEIKYNISKSEIEEILSEGEIELEYNKDFSKKLLNRKINELNTGEEIKITMFKEDNMDLKIKIEANVKRDGNEVNVEREFNKSWWMDEI